jgi:hypothetical protein
MGIGILYEKMIVRQASVSRSKLQAALAGLEEGKSNAWRPVWANVYFL